MRRDTAGDDPASSAAVRAAWNAVADWWQARQGNDDADHAHRVLIFPTIIDLLAPQSDDHILEIACGTGNLSRRIARAGARVVAFDIADALLDHARRLTPNDLPITYHHLDATDTTALRTLGDRTFDAAVCSMALHDMPEIDPLLSSLPMLIKPGGRFVFSVTHPCFNNGHMSLVREQHFRSTWRTTSAVKITAYAAAPNEPGFIAPGQPTPIPQFNRSLQDLFGSCLRAGLILDEIREPVSPPDPQMPPDDDNIWTRIPMFLMTRWRIPA